MQFLALFPGLLRSQDVAATGAAGAGAAAVAPDTAPAAPMPSPPPATPAATLPSVAELTAMRQAAAQDAELDDATRMQLDQHFAKALENFQAVEQSERKLAALDKELDSAPQQVEEFQARLSSPPPAEPAVVPPADGTVEGLSARLKEAEGASEAAEQHLQEIKAEIDRRTARRPQLGDLKSQAEQQLQETTQALAAPAPEGEHARVTAARLLRLQIRQLRLRRELALLEQEARTYEGTAKSWSLQQDLAEREVRETDRAVQQWQQRLVEAQRQEAEEDERQARRALAQSHPSVRKEAERNSALADRNSGLVESLRDSQLRLDAIDEELQTRAREFESLSKRAEAANFSPAIGVLLRNRQADLPDADDLRRDIVRRQSAIGELNLSLMEWDAERKPLIDLAVASTKVIATLEQIPESITKSDLEEQVQSLLAARLKLLEDLIENGHQQLNLLVRLDSQQCQLVTAVDTEAQWLAEHVLWVRSTHVVGSQPRLFLSSLSQLLDQRAWRSAGRTLLIELSSNWLWWTAALATLPGMFVLRRRAKQAIRRLGEVAARANCVDIMPTVKAVLLTQLVATHGPLFVWLIGWRINAIAGADDLLKPLGASLQLAAVSWAAVALLRQMSQGHGLAEAHFGWPRPALTALRRTTRFLAMATLPLVALVAFAEEIGESEIVATIGRLAYLGGMACFAWAMFRLLRPTGPMLQALKTNDTASSLYRARGVWLALFFALPLVLAGLSAAGFHYTAVQFTVARPPASSVPSSFCW
ncbi:MAG: hypothetical protein U0992_19390 [Planctomycetaceae bacterium]